MSEQACQAVEGLSAAICDVVAARILAIVAGNSGGLKFTKLMALLVAEGLIHLEPDEVLTIIRANKICSDAIDILEYVWDMGGGIYREKLFIHTKYVCEDSE